MSEQMREEFEHWQCDADDGPQTDPMWMIYNAEANTYALDKIHRDWVVWQSCCQSTPPIHPLQQVLRANGDLIAAQATIAQQAQMIEHLRGGPTPLYTAVDMATAAADGFRDGAASVVVDMPKMYPMDEARYSSLKASYNDAVRLCKRRIIAAGGSVKP